MGTHTNMAATPPSSPQRSHHVAMTPGPSNSSQWLPDESDKRRTNKTRAKDEKHIQELIKSINELAKDLDDWSDTAKTMLRIVHTCLRHSSVRLSSNEMLGAHQKIEQATRSIFANWRYREVQANVLLTSIYSKLCRLRDEAPRANAYGGDPSWGSGQREPTSRLGPLNVAARSHQNKT